ncbi:hypothetical protein QVD17_10745 [Tagetes erecta]|uniref:Integrase catalytic domain-containing protein n=1 Tax=Tagetes erecta TaxID=13708 RepID=A0AAD8L8J6_TARER|nr:hypothetical protein QVD17_10745 [Tagetes erecta]
MVETDKSAETNKQSSSETTSTALHLAFSVNNIHTKIRTLDGEKVTYSSWTKLVILHVKAFDLYHHIDGTAAPAKTDEDYKSWEKLDSLVLQWIYSTLPDDLFARVLEADTTARDAWLKVETIFLNNKNSRDTALEYEFSNLQLTACTSLDAYCQKLKDLANQLGDVGYPVSESRLVLQLVVGLPKEYDVVAAIINQGSSTWDEARNKLHLEVQRQNRRSTMSSASSAVLVAQGNNNNSTPRPNGYQGKNYDPNYNANRGRNNNTRGRGRNQTQRGRGRGNQYGNQGNNSQYGNNQQQWSGWTPPPSPYPNSGNQHGPNGQFQNIGPNGQFHNGGQFQHNGPSGQFQNLGPNGQFTGYTDYTPMDLAQSMQQVNLSSPDQSWYMDIGATSHLTTDPGKISTKLSSSPINSIFVGNGHSIPICGSGHTTHPTPNRTYTINNILFTPDIIKNLLSVRRFTIDNKTTVEFDPYGFTVKDLETGAHLSRHNSSGDLYPFTTSADSFTFVTPAPDQWHNRLGHPGESILHLSRTRFSLPYTFNNFAKFHRFVRTQFNCNIKAFQCDLGGEFDNNDFKSFADKHGFVFRFSCPQTSQQNGRAERMIRRLNDIMRTMLAHAHLPPPFWVEALHTAVYLHNILPTKRLNFSTPHYALFRCHPTYDGLRVFGCACYPNNTATMPHKLHPRSRQCIFLGYLPDHRGYRCYDQSTRRVLISCHVAFDESTFPYADPPNPDSYDFLDDPSFHSPHFFTPFQTTISTPTQTTTTPTPTHTANSPNYNPPNSPLPDNPTQTTPPHQPTTAPQPQQPTTTPSPTQPIQPTPNIRSTPNPTHTNMPSATNPIPSFSQHSMNTRAKSGIVKPITRLNLHTSSISPIPKSHNTARSDPNWFNAMINEHRALLDNDTWELVPRPHDHRIIRCAVGC